MAFVIPRCYTMLMKLSTRAHYALSVAEEAGRLLMQEATNIQQAKSGSQHITQKQNNVTNGLEIVTSVDRMLDDYIIQSIRKKYPHDFLLTEESYKETSSAKRVKQKSVWIIDPIDGTKDFSQFLLGRATKKRQHSFSICIAWARGGELQLGVVYAPVLGEIWIAEKDRGTWYRKGAKPWVKLKMQPATKKEITIGLNSHERVIKENLYRFPGQHFVFPSSLAYRIVATTAGHHDALISFRGGSKEWDVAAADIIVHEAGGRLQDSWGHQLHYNKPDLVNHTMLIAGHPSTIERLLPHVQQFSVAFVGSISHSTPLYSDGIRERFGGGVIYGAETAKKLGLDVRVVTIGARDIEGGVKQLTAQNIQATRAKRTKSNNFAIDYRTAKRIIRMSSVLPSSLTEAELRRNIAGVNGLILNPIYQEITPSIIPDKRLFPVFLDIQGLTRKVKLAKDSYYYLVDHRWNGWKQWRNKVDILRVSDEDIEHMYFPPSCKSLKQKMLHLTKNGFPLVVLTQGSQATLVATPAKFFTVPTYQVRAVDTGGAGDSFNAGFMTGYLYHRDPVVAAAFGNATASYKVSGKGTSAVPDIATITKRAMVILKKIHYAF